MTPFSKLNRPISHGGGDGLYYCCNCGDGPKSIIIQPACINCGHVGCPQCSADGARPASENYGIGSSDACESHTITATIKPPIKPPPCFFDSHMVNPSTPTRLASPDIGPPPDVNICGDRNTPFTNGIPTDGNWVWYCSACGDGPMGCATHVQCISCGHIRCGKCSLEETPK